jgi:hypothetical protein
MNDDVVTTYGRAVRFWSLPEPRELSDVDRMRTMLARFLADQLITAQQYQECRAIDRRYAEVPLPTFRQRALHHKMMWAMYDYRAVHPHPELRITNVGS